MWVDLKGHIVVIQLPSSQDESPVFHYVLLLNISASKSLRGQIKIKLSLNFPYNDILVNTHLKYAYMRLKKITQTTRCPKCFNLSFDTNAFTPYMFLDMCQLNKNQYLKCLFPIQTLCMSFSKRWREKKAIKCNKEKFDLCL